MSSARARAALRAGAIAAAGGAALAAATAAAARHRLLIRPLPQTEGTLRVPGITGAVEIARDRWGVPHLSASTRPDLWFGQGFVHAQDRLWQMDFYRRVARGRLSEIAGEAGLPSDRLMRTLGIHYVAEREQEALEPGLRGLLKSYCAGVNAAQGTLRALPFEFQDPAARVRAMDPRRHPRPRQAALLRPLGQLGARAAAGRHGAGAGAGADGAPRPCLPGREPDRDAGALGWGRARPGRADRRRPQSSGDVCGGRGVQQLGGQRRPQLDRGPADRRRPPPVPEHAGDLAPGRPLGGGAPRRGRLDGRAAGHPDGTERRRRLDLHEHGRRHPGPVHRADRGGSLPVRG